VGIRNFSPHFRNIADHRIDCEIADLKKVVELQLRTFKIALSQFRNFQLLIFSYMKKFSFLQGKNTKNG
jgi:hypothetical protein